MKYISLIILMLVISLSINAETIASYDMTTDAQNNLVDISGNGHTSNGLGGAVLQASTYGNALSFDGSDRVVIDSAPDLKLNAPISIEAKFMVTGAATDWVRIVGKGEPGPRNYGLWYNYELGRFLFQIYSAGGSMNAYIDLGVTLNQWYHIAGTYDGTIGRLYLDGTQIAKHTISITPYTSDDPLTIGGAYFHTLHKGLIDDVAVYNHLLSADDIASSALIPLTGVVPEPSSLLFFSILAYIFIGIKRKK